MSDDKKRMAASMPLFRADVPGVSTLSLPLPLPPTPASVDGAAAAAAPPVQPTAAATAAARRGLLLLVLAALFMLAELLDNGASSIAFLTAGSSTSTLRHGGAASAAAAALAAASHSAWSSYYDVSTLPLLRAGAQSDQSMLVHEREADVAAFLYAENGLSYIVDTLGPVCLPRLFLAISGNSEYDPAHANTLVIFEVDGRVVGNISFRDLFLAPIGDNAADLASNDTASGGATAWPGHAAFPQPLTFSIEHEVGVRSGLVLNAPVCAAARLRLALDFRPKGQHSAAVLMSDGSDCVARDTQCQMPIYINAQLLRFLPAASLPNSWRGFDASSPAAPLPPGPPRRTWLSERLIEEALRDGDPARSVLHCADLPRSSKGREFEFLIFESRTPGVAALLTLDFPGAEHLLHSKGVRLVAEWDGGRGLLDIDLESLLGPPFLLREEEPSARKSLFFLGERRGTGTIGVGLGADATDAGAISDGAKIAVTEGLYLALPMPWWSSCTIRVVLSHGAATAARPSLDAAADQEQAIEPEVFGRKAGAFAAAVQPRVCAALVVMRPEVPAGRMLLDLDPHGEIAAGYLQGHTVDVPPSLDLRGRTRNDQVLVDIAQARGALIALSFNVHLSHPTLVEGDVRVWPDGRATPTIWSTGLEDFFSGSHAYRYVPHSNSALFAWDRVQSVDSRSLSLFQTRAFMLDAPRFSSSLRIALEASSPHAMVGRACALFYALPSREARATDSLEPGNAADRAAHGYNIAVSVGSGLLNRLRTYDLDSILPSEGEGDAQRVIVLGVAAVPSGATIEFSLNIDQGAQFVVLRRLVDVRYSVQHARIAIDGAEAFKWLSTDRHWVHLDTHWREEARTLPPALTQGKARLRITVATLADNDKGSNGTHVGIERTYVPGASGPAWTEARWQAVSVPFLH